jgi:hypothetical protein
VERENYDLVYTAPLNIHDRQSNLHKIFQDFNTDRPADFKGHSLSVSDVIVLQWRGEVSAHFVDSVGFRELSHFTGNEREQKFTLSEQEAIANIPRAKANAQEHANKQPPLAKKKPSLLGRLEANKKIVAQQKAMKSQKIERRPDDERTLHG